MTLRSKRCLLFALLAVLAGVVTLVVIFKTGLADRWARATIIRRIEESTGARVELGAFHFQLFGLRAELDNLTLHGLESEGLPPLFHADRIRIRLHILSFFGRKIALDELLVDKPEVFIRIGEDGRSNVPSPRVHRAGRPWREQLFDLRIGRLRLSDGSLLFNNARAPLAIEADDFQFSLNQVNPSPGTESYVGAIGWIRMDLAARRYLPFRSDVTAKFTLSRNAFSLDELQWKLPHSQFQVRADLASFARPEWTFNYRGRLNLEDLRAILRKPNTPSGTVEFTGSGHYSDKHWSTTGHYRANDIDMRYTWFHAGGIESWGDYEATQQGIVVPQLEARALSGSLNGRLETDLPGLNFRVVSRVRGASLAAILAAVDNSKFPVHALHWAGSVDVDSVSTWSADFKHFSSKGESRWSPPAVPGAGEIPAEARLDFDYSADRRGVALAPSEITTPTSRVEMAGTLHALDSATEVRFHTDNLEAWDDFINILRGPEAEPRRIAGRVDWKGRVLGPLGGPTFAGHVHAYDARYDTLFWDELDGDMEYSPDELRLSQMQVRRGGSSASLDLWLQLDGDWSFLPSDKWSFDARLDRGLVSDLQSLFGTAYPLAGFLSGDFHGGGIRSDSAYDANFILEDGETSGLRFERLSGQLHWSNDELRLSHAELQKGTGRVLGDILLHPRERDVNFHLTGANLPLIKVEHIQTTSLPIAGLLSFDLQGQGPLLAPVAQGTLRLSKIQVGSEEQGDFVGRLDSDGHRVQFALDSEKTKGNLNARLELGLSGDYPLSGEIRVEGFDLDPLIVSGLHLKALTGHSSVDARFQVNSALLRPDTLLVEADLSRANFDYEFVKLENVGAVRLSYRRDEVRIEQAELHGPDTDFHIAGFARFDRDRPLNLNITGTVNLRLATALVPGLEANGAARVDTSIEGSFSRPRITGRASLNDASALYGDFPTGLSHVTGEFLFDRNRLLFDNVSAEAGGGSLSLSGSVNYGEGPVEYQITAKAPRVRIRYPEGVSWLAGGSLQLSGDAHAGQLSGSVAVERLLLGEGVDLATLFAASQDTVHGPATTSPYLRNLQFDVEGTTAPNARLEWTGAHVEMEGSVRLRGTWERPLLLGHIHLLSGEMAFRGNKYQLTRGDINFSNPFRLDPVLNVEETTKIGQYEVTLNFTGPASRLNLSYRSDPPLPDSDVVALLALGSTGGESALRTSSTTASQNYGATALLSEAISSQLGGRIEHLFGISHFRVDPFLAGTTTEQNAAARVTIEQQVARDLTVTYSTNATSNQQQVIQAEYAARRNLSVIFLRDLNGTYSMTIEFKRHFK